MLKMTRAQVPVATYLFKERRAATAVRWQIMLRFRHAAGDRHQRKRRSVTSTEFVVLATLE